MDTKFQTGDWISTKDALPAAGEEVLILYRSMHRSECLMSVAHLYKYSKGNDVSDRDCGYEFAIDGVSGARARAVLYWMPIPKKPAIPLEPDRRKAIFDYEPLRLKKDKDGYALD